MVIKRLRVLQLFLFFSLMSSPLMGAQSSIAAPVSHEPVSHEPAAAESDETIGEQPARELNRQKFLRDHSDPSGFVRPDLWRKGMEHARQMEVVRNIGAGAISLKPGPPLYQGQQASP